MSQTTMALYIYRVGGLAPQEILLQDLNLWKSLIVLGLCLDRSDPPVRPVGRARLATYASTGQTAWTHRSDRSLPILVVNTTQHGVVTSLPLTTTKYRTSLYADAVAIFLHPNQNELQAVKDILEMFGNNITGLITNFEKKVYSPNPEWKYWSWQHTPTFSWGLVWPSHANILASSCTPALWRKFMCSRWLKRFDTTFNVGVKSP